MDIPIGVASRQNSRVTSSKAMEKDVGSEAKLDDGLTYFATPSKKLRERRNWQLRESIRTSERRLETTGKEL